MMVFAHLGHLLIDVPLYGGPVILLVMALAVSSIRARRAERSLVRHGDEA